MRLILAVAFSLMLATSALANRKLLLFVTTIGGGGGPAPVSTGFVLQTDAASFILLVDGVSKLRKVN